MTAGKRRLINEGYIFDSFWCHSHKKGRLVNDSHLFDSFWGHSHTSTAPWNQGFIKYTAMTFTATNIRNFMSKKAPVSSCWRCIWRAYRKRRIPRQFFKLLGTSLFWNVDLKGQKEATNVSNPLLECPLAVDRRETANQQRGVYQIRFLGLLLKTLEWRRNFLKLYKD